MKHFDLVNSLTAMLTIKLGQDDLKIVDSIKSYTESDGQRMEEQLEQRGWGPSVLIVDKDEDFPEPLRTATSNINHINLMSTVGLNPLSMAKHETMVVTYDALREIENRLLYQLIRTDLNETRSRYRE